MSLLGSYFKLLLKDLGNNAGAYCPAAFPYGESYSLFHRHWRYQRYFYLCIVTRHYHVALELLLSRHVRRPKVELRFVARC